MAQLPKGINLISPSVIGAWYTYLPLEIHPGDKYSRRTFNVTIKIDFLSSCYSPARSKFIFFLFFASVIDLFWVVKTTNKNICFLFVKRDEEEDKKKLVRRNKQKILHLPEKKFQLKKKFKNNWTRCLIVQWSLFVFITRLRGFEFQSLYYCHQKISHLNKTVFMITTAHNEPLKMLGNLKLFIIYEVKTSWRQSDDYH